jgi:hypothetical protein
MDLKLCEANSCLAILEILRILCNYNVYYCVHKKLAPTHMMMNSVHTLFIVLYIYFNILLPKFLVIWHVLNNLTLDVISN